MVSCTESAGKCACILASTFLLSKPLVHRLFLCTKPTHPAQTFSAVTQQRARFTQEVNGSRHLFSWKLCMHRKIHRTPSPSTPQLVLVRRAQGEAFLYSTWTNVRHMQRQTQLATTQPSLLAIKAVNSSRRLLCLMP